MILEIENNFGHQLGAVHVVENGPHGIEVINSCGDLSIADYDFDDIFDTNDKKIRIQLDRTPSTAFRSGNHESCVSPLEQELGAYKALLKSFQRKDYYDCAVLIINYFGHIDYGCEFGYFKTHDEICNILFTTLLTQLSEDYDSKAFENFVHSMINKCEYNLEKK